MITSRPSEPFPPPISILSNFNNSTDKTPPMLTPSSPHSLCLVDQTSANEDDIVFIRHIPAKRRAQIAIKQEPGVNGDDELMEITTSVPCSDESSRRDESDSTLPGNVRY